MPVEENVPCLERGTRLCTRRRRWLRWQRTAMGHNPLDVGHVSADAITAAVNLVQRPCRARVVGFRRVELAVCGGAMPTLDNA